MSTEYKEICYDVVVCILAFWVLYSDSWFCFPAGGLSPPSSGSGTLDLSELPALLLSGFQGFGLQCWWAFGNVFLAEDCRVDIWCFGGFSDTLATVCHLVIWTYFLALPAVTLAACHEPHTGWNLSLVIEHMGV